MRIAFFVIISLFAILSAKAGDMRVTVHSARPFGYFVGDLIRARVEIVSPAEATLTASSLPHPGPISGALELRDLSVHTASSGGGKRWDIDLVYQNFYVALDARNIEIPAFDLRFGDEIVTVPAWSVGVAPLREIIPSKHERSEDYLRPAPPVSYAEETPPKRLALAFATLSFLCLLAVARDRAWPPFHKRRERIFNALARELAALSLGDVNAPLHALQRMHRALDRANGASLLPEDLSGFFEFRPEFCELRPHLERFFAASNNAFFGSGSSEQPYTYLELLNFARALARQERSR